MNLQKLKKLREQAWIPTPLGDKFSLHFDDELYMKLVAQCVAQDCMEIVQREASTYAEPTWAFEIVNDIRKEFDLG